MKYTKGSFIVVPNKNILSGLPPEVQSVYFWICNFANDEGVCFPSVTTIAKNSGVSKRKVFDCITTLERIFLLQKQSRKDGKKNLTNIYQLNIVAEEDYKNMGGSAQDALGSAPRAVGGSAPRAERTQSIIELNIPNSITETSSVEIGEVIKCFETINPASKKFYSRKVERDACSELVKLYGFEKVKSVIEKTLPKTNKMPYFPQINSPLKLFEKWSTLESAIIQWKSRNNKTKVAILSDKVKF